MSMDPLTLLPESRARRRRMACWKKARRRIRYAKGYLNKLLAGAGRMSEQQRQILARDVEDLLDDARGHVRKGRRLGAQR